VQKFREREGETPLRFAKSYKMKTNWRKNEWA
jgi:hypothetical protein